HRVSDLVSEVGFCVTLQLHERAGADLLRRVALPIDLVGLPVGAHVTLHRSDGAVNVRHGLALRGLTDEHLAVLRECDDRWRGAKPLGIRDDGRLATFEDRNNRVGGTEVNTYCTRHAFSFYCY